MQRPKRGGVRSGALIDRTSGSVRGSPEDPLLLFSILNGFWAANFVAFNGEALRELAAQFLALAEKQADFGPNHDRASPDGHSLAHTGDLVKGIAHYDKAIRIL